MDTPTCTPNRFFKFDRAHNKRTVGRVGDFNSHDIPHFGHDEFHARDFHARAGSAGLASLFSSQTTRTNSTFSKFGEHFLIIAGHGPAWSLATAISAGQGVFGDSKFFPNLVCFCRSRR